MCCPGLIDVHSSLGLAVQIAFQALASACLSSLSCVSVPKPFTPRHDGCVPSETKSRPRRFMQTGRGRLAHHSLMLIPAVLLRRKASTKSPGLPPTPSRAAGVPARFRERRVVRDDKREMPVPVTFVPRRVRVVRPGSDATASIVSSSTLIRGTYCKNRKGLQTRGGRQEGEQIFQEKGEQTHSKSGAQVSQEIHITSDRKITLPNMLGRRNKDSSTSASSTSK